ncbi:hypothetical protein B0H13DRAFT_1648327, partial [Mycena leptocephala]
PALPDTVKLEGLVDAPDPQARHQTILNILSSTSAIPAAFDIVLTPQEVISIFINGPCDLGVTRKSSLFFFVFRRINCRAATNTLTVTNTGPIAEGTLTVSATNISGTDNLFCNMITGGAPFAINIPLAHCTVPPGINGPVALWITSDNNPLINSVVDRDTTKQVAGPAIFFVDSQSEMLGSMVLSSGTNGAPSSTQTTTISPDEASSIIAGAATQTAALSSSTGSSGSDGANGAAAAPTSTHECL